MMVYGDELTEAGCGLPFPPQGRIGAAGGKAVRARLCRRGAYFVPTSLMLSMRKPTVLTLFSETKVTEVKPAVSPVSLTSW